MLIDKKPSGALVGLGNLLLLRSNTHSSSASSTNILAGTSAAVSSSSSSSGIVSSISSVAGSQAAVGHRKLLLLSQELDQNQGASHHDGAVGNLSTLSVIAPPQQPEQHQRTLQQVIVQPGDDHLDGFRRGPARERCAGTAATTWKMTPVEQVVDVAAYRALVIPHDIVDIIAEACKLLSA